MAMNLPRLPESPHRRRWRRARGGRLAVFAALGVLGIALFQLQVAHSGRYALAARENRLRRITIPAPRGIIYDRHREVVAGNDVAYAIDILPAPEDTLRAELERLRPVLELTDAQVDVALAARRRSPSRPLEVLDHASPVAVARLEERLPAFPEVLVRPYPRRRYPEGDTVGRLVGYLGEISERELQQPAFRGDEAGQFVGKAGLEREYEHVLAGVAGTRYLEVDARGHIQRFLPSAAETRPVPGRDLHLYLDLDLQRHIAGIFPDSLRGAFVALDPSTGGVLAYYSRPGFDPNAFTGGIAAGTWDTLRSDPAHPLLDRAGRSVQPPGSTFKLVVAAMALRAGIITAASHMPIPCTGGIEYEGRYWKCWCSKCYWDFDLAQAIEHSCDVYFYQLGMKLGLDRLLALGRELGLERPTGIDLPGEAANVFPVGRAWWLQHFGYRPEDSEVLSLAIGQGPISLTPLKIAQIYEALAREDGKAPAPRLARTAAPDPITLDLGLDRAQLTALRNGMRRVVGPGGTAWLSRLRDWELMGKTGTAQNAHGADNAVFAGIGGPPGGKPEIVAVLYLEHGLHGAIASGYVADAIEYYLDREHGRPFPQVPVPRERIARGLPVDWKWLRSPVVDTIASAAAAAGTPR